MDRYFAPLVAKASGDEEQAVLAKWSFEVQEPKSKLGQLETARLRRLADRFLLDCPSSEQNRDTGLFYIPDLLRRKLKREIRDARRERVRWWVQAVVMPLIGLLGVTAALLSVYLTLRLNSDPCLSVGEHRGRCPATTRSPLNRWLRAPSITSAETHR